MSGTIRLDQKNEKLTRLLTDFLALIDEENKIGGIAPLKKIQLSNLGLIPDGGTTGQVLKKTSDDDLDIEWGEGGGSGGSGVSVTTNIVRVEPNAEEDVVGKLYSTYADALAYIKTQSPSSENPWVIELPSGEFTENIEFNKDLLLIGHNTIITGNISSTFLYDIGRADGSATSSLKENIGYIQDCILTNLNLSDGGKLITSNYKDGTTYNIDDEISYRDPMTEEFIGYYKSLQNDNIGNAPDLNPLWWEQIPNDTVGLPTLVTKNCVYEIATFVKSPLLPCYLINIDSQINSGDFTGMCILLNIDGVITGGTFPEILEPFDDFITFFAYNTKIFGGTFNCGQILGCMIQNSTFNNGKYEFTGCPQIFNCDIYIKKDSYILNNFLTDTYIYMDNIEEKFYLYITKNIFEDVELSYVTDPSFNGNLVLTSNNGDLLITHTPWSNINIKYVGEYYNNINSRLSANNTQDAIDETIPINQTPSGICIRGGMISYDESYLYISVPVPDGTGSNFIWKRVLLEAIPAP